MKGAKIPLLLASLVIGPLLTTGVSHADGFENARLRIHGVMTAHHIPSVTVAVAYKGRIVWEEGFGWADIAKRTPATSHTPYYLASISKPVTATALMVLAERGKIDLDRPMDDYLGEQKLTARAGSASEATIRRVASHTAGLPLHARFFYEDEGGSAPGIDETIRRYGTIVAAPGETFVYSNLGYGLIEYAIERASGKSYPEFLRSAVFAPLQLGSAAVTAGADPRNPVASRYWFNDIPVPFYESDQRGAGAVIMSAHDLARFGMFQLYGRVHGQRASVLKHDTLTSMQVAAKLTDGATAGYGIGWFVGQQHGLRWFGHNGGMAGVATVLSIYPEAEAVIVVLANGVSRTGAVHFLEADIVHDLLPETIRNDHGFKPQPELIGRWQGEIQTYAGRTRLMLDFKQTGSVFVRVGTGPVREVTKVTRDDKTAVLSLGDVIGDITTPDAARHPGNLQLSLKLRAPDTLSGTVSSNSLETLSDRMGDAVSYWVELRRELFTPAGGASR